MFENLALSIVAIIVFCLLAFLIALSKFYRKAEQGKALVRTGVKTHVSFGGMWVFPIIHRLEIMDISVKRIEIHRDGKDGLICKDNLRADIKVVFFVRVNPTEADVVKVAQSIGCARASNQGTLVELFDAKFSEALKTVGKKFDFVELYNERDHFKAETRQIIGTDLNGYSLEDTAIDYLEQTSIDQLDPRNILDSEGIKKITDLTAKQRVLSNKIDREREKTLKQQDVEAREQILELERHQAEAEERQRREITSTKARETAETMKVQQEERLKAEHARITTEEEIQIAEENRQRQVLVANMARRRTEAVETERVEKDRLLEVNERERVVTLANIERERAVEEERKNIQEIIRERVTVQRGVVEEEEKIKDTQVKAEAERQKSVVLTEAQARAEEAAMMQIKAAEASRKSAEMKAEQDVIEADAQRKASDLQAEARKRMAEATAAEDAVIGMAEAQVIEAKAVANQKHGTAEAEVMERKALAEAKGIEAKAAALTKQGAAEAEVIERKGLADANVIERKGLADAAVIERRADAHSKEGDVRAAVSEKQGSADATILERKAGAEANGIQMKAVAMEKQGEVEARVLQLKAVAEANGIEKKAEAMKVLDGEGRAHEEFKLQLALRKDIELASLDTQKDIAAAQALVLQKALETAKIDIVGGEGLFFDKLINSISRGKSVDRLVDNSRVLGDIKETFFNGDPEYFKAQLKRFVSTFGMSTEDVKNLSLAALVNRMMTMTGDEDTRSLLGQGLALVNRLGLSDKPAKSFLD